MAKMPTSYTEWTDAGGAAYRSEPPAPEKAIGFVYEQKPPFEEFNWLIWNLGQWIRWVKDIFTDYAVVGTGTDVDYALPSLAIAAGYTKILLITDITVGTAEDISMSDGVFKTNGFKILNSAGVAADGVLKISGSNNEIDVDIDCTQAGPTTAAGILVTGNSNRIKARIIQSGVAGVITNGIRVSGDGNRIDGYIGLTGAGTITTGLRFDAAGEGNQCDLIMNRKIGTFTTTYVDAGTANDFRIVDIT